MGRSARCLEAAPLRPQPSCAADCMEHATAMSLVERAIEIANRELEQLEQGEVEDASKLAHDRRLVLDEAFLMERREDEDLRLFREKLVELQQIQRRLNDEALRLHERIREELGRSRQETKRHAGYASAGRAPQLMSRFVSRQS